MDVAEGARKGDITLEEKGLKVFLEKKANRVLSDSTIDFSDERGFVISGMQRSSCCG
jgi:Fe-S cluster assembly iron-binding protein IscA